MLPGIIGTLQATEAIKVLTGIGDPMIGRFLHYDALKANFKTFNIRKDPDCGICGKNPTIKTISKISGYDDESEFDEIDVVELAELIKREENLNLIDVRNPDEIEEFHIEKSQFIPLPELEERFSEIDTSKKIFLICKSGMRSTRAAAILKAKGLCNIKNVKGGVDEWKNKFATS